MKQKLINLVVTEVVICLFTLPLVLWAIIDQRVDNFSSVLLITLETVLIVSQGIASWKKSSMRQY